MVERLWPNSTVVCLATGPSLTVEDCDFVRGKAHVIAINDAHRLAPWADVLYSSDRQWWPHHHGVPTFQGMKMGIGSTVGKANPFHAHPDIRVLLNTGYSGIETDPRGLRNGRNSGYAAINLAIHFGASRILLLGYDMGRKAGKLHFFGDHQGMNNTTDALFVSFRRAFDSMIEPLQALGVEVINCTEQSSLECFPKRALRDVLVAAEAVA